MLLLQYYSGYSDSTVGVVPKIHNRYQRKTKIPHPALLEQQFADPLNTSMKVLEAS